MKIRTKITAVMLALAIIFSLVSVPASALTKEDAYSYKLGRLIDGSSEMPNLGDMIKSIRTSNKMINKILGVPIFSEENFNLMLDETMSQFSADILMNSGVDFSEVYNNFPKLNCLPELISQSQKIDISLLRKLLNFRADRLSNNGKIAESFLIRWVSAWLNVIDECEFACVPIEGQDGAYRIVANITYRDGSTDVLYSDLMLDTENQMLTSLDGGPAVIGYYLDINQAMTYTAVHTWQRLFGFSLVYDIFIYLNRWFMDYTTERIKFIYDDMEWMCQIWKGKYLITNGGEVGFYNRPIGSKGSFYRCATDEYLMDMSLDVYHGDTVIVHREKTPHWWITGFTISDTLYLPITLTLVSTITMLDYDMLNAFTEALDKKKTIKYEVNDLDVTIVW